MELFYTILPFIVPLLVLIQIYHNYKNRKKVKEKKTSKFEQYKLYRYLKTIYVERGIVKFWSAIWYVPLLFGSVFGIVSIFGHFQDSFFPPIPLEKMQTQTGTIESVQLRRNMDAILVLKNDQNKQAVYAIHTTQKEAKLLLHKKAKVWYTKGWSSGFTVENIIYEITNNEKSIRYFPYNYEHHLEVDKEFLNFTLTLSYICLFSLFMIWVQNRKELPAHRLYRLKRYQKLQKLKGEK